MFMHYLGSFLLQNMLSSLPDFAFEGQNMKFTVNMLLTCILYCEPGPAVIRTVCMYSRQSLITDDIFVLVHFSSHGLALMKLNNGIYNTQNGQQTYA